MSVQRPGRYDVRHLTVEVVERGFVIGLSKLGDRIGSSGVRTDVSDAVTSVRVDRKRTVRDDLYIGATQPSCTVTLAFPDQVPRLKDKLLVVSYRGQELFRGNVNVATRSVDVDNGSRTGKKWAVAMQSADYNQGSRKLALSQYTSELAMGPGIIEKLPGITSVNVADSVLHRFRTFRMAPGTAWGTELVEQSTFLDSVAGTLQCVIDIDPENSRVLRLRGYEDGVTWELSDRYGAELSYTSLSIAEDSSFPTSVSVASVAVDNPPTPAEGETFDPAPYTVTRSLSGVVRNDKVVRGAFPLDQNAARLLSNLLPVFSSLPESVRSLSVPFFETLDLSDDPALVRVWLDGKLWQGTVTGVVHDIRPGNPPYTAPEWMISVEVGELYLITRSGATLSRPTGVELSGTVLSWDQTPGAVYHRVTRRTDRWAQYLNDGAGTSVAVAAGNSLDLSWLLTPGTKYYVSVWPMIDANKYGEPWTLEVTL